MAQAIQGGIIDLTGEDDNDASVSRAHAACEKAFEAASRITDHFESLKTFKSSNNHVDLSEEGPLPAHAQESLVPARLLTSPNPAGSETDGLKKVEKNRTIPRQAPGVPSSGVPFSRSSLGTAASTPAKSPLISEGVEGNKQQPREGTSLAPGPDTSTVRTPRSAALSAKQNIADTCNELEEWANKDPKLIQQQAGVNTPKKPGRPKKDPDEWSPSSNTKTIVEERKGLVRAVTTSPTPSAGKHGALVPDEDKNLPVIKEFPTDTKKRKYSGSSLSRDSPVKLARWNEDPRAHYEYIPANSHEPADKKHASDAAGKSSPAGCFPRCVYPAIKAGKARYAQAITEDVLFSIGQRIVNDILKRGVEAFCPASVGCPQNQRTELILKSVSEAFNEKALQVRSGLPINLVSSADHFPNGFGAPPFKRDLEASPLERVPLRRGTFNLDNKSLSKASTAGIDGNGALGKESMLHTQEKIDPRLQTGVLEASNPTTSKPEPYSAPAGDAGFAALFESVVNPALKKSKKHHKGSLPWEVLDGIGKTIVNDVLDKLASHSEDSYPLDEVTKKKIKYFVKKSFRQKVRKANAHSSHNSITPAQDLRLGRATRSPGSSGLGGLTEGETIYGVHRPRASGPNHSENVSSGRAIAVGEKEEAQAPRQPHTKTLDQQQSSTSQISPNESASPTLGPDFDRGRYPAQRRKRGNKYFTPARTSNTTPNLKLNHSQASDGHLLPQAGTGLSTDPASTVPGFNQRSTVSTVSNGKDQVRLLKALANHPATHRTSQTQLTALTTAAEKKRIPTDQRSALELLASTEDLTDVRETPAEGRGPAFSHVARPRNSTANPPAAQRTPYERPLKDTGPQQEPRPTFRPKPATALDPSLEHVVAVLVIDRPGRTTRDEQRYSITPTNRTQLVADRSIVKHVDLTSEAGKPKFVRVETEVVDPMRRPGHCISSLLRNRELGLSSRGRHVGTVDQLRQLKSETIEPWKSWKGASGDVVTVAWSPDSNVYAFGAAAHANIEDIQYNRPCNLLLGNLASNQIKELPDHRIDRPKPETIPNGPNATQAVYDACDPNVYETVTSIAFSPAGDRMFTASHDCTVKIWDISAGKHECLSTLRHEAWVTSVEISGHQEGLFATASKCVKDAIRIYYDPGVYVSFSASRAEMRPDWKIYPECLRWGPNPYNSHLLLAGFQQWEQQGDLLSGGGQLCLWDAHVLESIKVTPSSQSVYAAAWHPTQPFFATGGAPSNNVVDKINTKTVVRTWDFRVPKRYQVEYECPAVDMQDITFSPLNPNVVTAGCTDGISYVWDWRWPDQPLHRLKHGRPLVDLDHTREREEADTGVMLSLWGPGGSLLYTGSSDGMIKAWDVRRHPSDVLIRNVANFGVSIQSGAFSPNGDNLLVGDAEGGIHVLSSAPCGPRSNVQSTDAYIDLVRALDGSGLTLDRNDDNPGIEGIEAAKSLVESGQLEYHKELGVGQGLNYKGPYATYARKEGDESAVGRLRKKFEKKQPISKRGEKRWEIAIPMTSLLHERKETLDRKMASDKMAVDNLTEHEAKTFQRPKTEETLRTSPFLSTPERAFGVSRSSSTNLVDPLANESVGAIVTDGNRDPSVEYNTISESEMVEENHWWERLGQEEIDWARAGRVRY